MKWIFWGVIAGAVIASPSLWRAHADPTCPPLTASVQGAIIQ